MRQAGGRSVGPVGGRKGINDEGIAEGRQVLDKGRVVFALAGIKTDILEKQQRSRGGGDRLKGSVTPLGADRGVDKCDIVSGQPGQRLGHKAERQRRIRPAPRASEVGNQDDPGAPGEQRFEGRQESRTARRRPLRRRARGSPRRSSRCSWSRPG